MASSSQDTATCLRQISANTAKCLAIWGDVTELCENWPSMSKGVIREKSIELKETLQQGGAIDVPYILPHAETAFKQGDGKSGDDLRRVMESQSNLMENLTHIKQQLAAATQAAPATGPRRAPNPERVLDIDTIWSLVDSVNTQRENTTEALQALSKRVSDVAPPLRSQSRHGPPLPGSFPSVQQYGYSQSPVTERTAKSPSVNSEDVSQPPTLRLRPGQPPPQPPRPAQSVVDLSPSYTPHFNSPPPQTRRKATEKQADVRPESPIKTPVRRSVDRASQNNPQTPAEPGVTSFATSTQNISHQPGKYCIGAIRLQENPHLNIADIVRDDLSSKPGINSHSICKHCNLELDTSLPEELLPCEEKRNTIAMQHIMACASLMDPRAMFRCLACAKGERDAEFRAVGELWGHIRLAHRRVVGEV